MTSPSDHSRAAAFVEHADRYSRLGWALVRCDGKKPEGKRWQHTEPEAPELAAGKWSEWGRRWNVGVVCGPSGLAIVDVDHDDSEAAVRELLGELPPTPTVRTGRGRLQVYFRDPGGLEKTVRDGLELRVGGHQCVAPPSAHPDTGREYVWLPGLEPWTVPLADLPDSVVEFFAHAREPNGRAAPVEGVIPHGSQHHTLVSLAGSMRRRGMNAAEIYAALWQVNINRCERPGTEDAIRKIAESVATYEPAEQIGKPAYDGPPLALEEVVETFRRWLHLPDPGMLYVTLAAVVANRLPGDPTWLLLVGASSSGKTEVLVSLADLEEVVPAATLTEASLLSGSPRKDIAAGATGGLLCKIGAYGILTLKDFGSILSMHHDTRMAALAALRECYDGAWDRPVGADGGKVLSWRGKLGLIAGVTTVVDRHHAVMDSLGSRFAFYRTDVSGRGQQASRSIAHRRQAAGMRDELRQAVAGFFAGLTLPDDDTLTDDDRDRLIALADFVTLARSPVERDSRTRDIELIPDAEAPARFVIVLADLLEGLRLIGLDEQTAWALVSKVAFDSMPAQRRRLLEHLSASATATTTAKDAATLLGLPTTTARRTLEDLAAHGLVYRTPAGKPGEPDTWTLAVDAPVPEKSDSAI